MFLHINLAVSGKISPLPGFGLLRYCEFISFNHMAPLRNYLRSHRKRLALSQEDVAFLLGNKGGAKMSRYEHFTREPSLETALALEVIFQRSASELFGGRYQQIEQDVIARARLLSERQTGRKRRILINIANKTLN